jgi:hypothetical protein
MSAIPPQSSRRPGGPRTPVHSRRLSAVAVSTWLARSAPDPRLVDLTQSMLEAEVVRRLGWTSLQSEGQIRDHSSIGEKMYAKAR